jgi:hypothetical protein
MPSIEVKSGDVEEILPWRDLYRQEMNCQIVHDSFHARPGWTDAKLLQIDGQMAGYGLIVRGGPWQGRPTVCEFYALPQCRGRAFDLFDEFLRSSQAVGIEVQSNDALATAMLHAFAANVKSESILFHDRLTTALSPSGALFRPAESAGEWIVECSGEVAAKGGILFHYNRPYGDIYMEVAESFRRRGFGSYLVQELKRVAYEGGNIPSARCNPSNLASRRTLQKAGFVPCAHMLSGILAT